MRSLKKKDRPPSTAYKGLTMILTRQKKVFIIQKAITNLIGTLMDFDVGEGQNITLDRAQWRALVTSLCL
jgi:hypothetical protein